MGLLRLVACCFFVVSLACSGGVQSESVGGAPRLPASDDAGSSSGEGGLDTDGWGSSTGDPGFDGSTGVEGSSTGAADSCPEDHVCLPAIPQPWLGPVLPRPDLGPSTCPDMYPRTGLRVGRELDAPPADCTCECEAPAPSCTPQIELVAGGPQCDPADPASQSFAVDEDGIAIHRPLPAYFTAHPPPEQPCQAIEQVQVEPSSLIDATVLCAGAVMPKGACESGSMCAPTADGPVCIWQPGEHACPSETFSVRSIHYLGVQDDRGCSPCSCEATGAACAEAIVELTASVQHPSGGLVPTSFELPADAQCRALAVPGTGSIVAARLELQESTATCQATAPHPTGVAELVDPITVCCTG